MNNDNASTNTDDTNTATASLAPGEIHMHHTVTAAILPPRVRGAVTNTVSAPVAPPTPVVAALRHSEEQEERRLFIKDRVGEGSILHITRSVTGEDNVTTERTILAQVKEVVCVRGRYGHTTLNLVEFGSAEVHSFNWRDDSVRSMKIADLNEISALMQKVNEEKVKAEAIAEHKRAENARKSASRNAKKSGSAPVSNEDTASAE